MKDRNAAGHQDPEEPMTQALSEVCVPPPEPIGAEALFRAHASFVAGFLGRLGVPASELEDLVQEVFIVAHRRGGYVPGAAKPRSWLGAIALRVAQSERRARRKQERDRKEAAAPLEAWSGPVVDPAEEFETQRALARVQEALNDLPIEHRAAFVLFEIEGESCESIAAVFGVPVGTVYSRLHNARRRFLAAYEAVSKPPAAARLNPSQGRIVR